jgi:hypothetical protein
MQIRYRVIGKGRKPIISSHRIQRCAFLNLSQKAWKGAVRVEKHLVHPDGSVAVLKVYP